MSDPHSTLCKHCGEPIFDNGTVYVHRRSTFDETAKTKYVIDSQWCNDATRIHMAESELSAVPSGGEQKCPICTGKHSPDDTHCEKCGHASSWHQDGCIALIREANCPDGEKHCFTNCMCRHDQPATNPTPEGLATLGIGSNANPVSSSRPWTIPGNEPPRAGMSVATKPKYWLIRYDDPDQLEEIFYGPNAEESARKRLEIARLNWTCHLFEEVAAPVPPTQQICSDCEADGCGKPKCRCTCHNPRESVVAPSAPQQENDMQDNQIPTDEETAGIITRKEEKEAAGEDREYEKDVRKLLISIKGCDQTSRCPECAENIVKFVAKQVAAKEAEISRLTADRDEYKRKWNDLLIWEDKALAQARELEAVNASLTLQISQVKQQLATVTTDRDSWKDSADMYARAWGREIGPRRPKSHLIDELVVATRELKSRCTTVTQERDELHKKLASLAKGEKA